MPARGAVLPFPFSPSFPSSSPLCDTAVMEVGCSSPGGTEGGGITSSGHKDPSSFLPTTHLSSTNSWAVPAVPIPMPDQPRVASLLFFQGFPKSACFADFTFLLRPRGA